MNNPSPQADMEDILSSIRNTLEEETGKVMKDKEGAAPEGAATAVETPAEEAGSIDDAEDDVLDLTDVPMVEEAAPTDAPVAMEQSEASSPPEGIESEQASTDVADEPEASEEAPAAPAEEGLPEVKPLAPEGPAEEVFDINAFATGGEARVLTPEEAAAAKAEASLGEDEVVEEVDVSAAEAAVEEQTEETPAAAEASDDFDRLLAELKEEDGDDGAAKDTPAAEPEPEEEPLDVMEAAIAEMPADNTPVADEVEIAEEAPEDALDEMEIEDVPAAPAAKRIQLPMIPASTGLQVGLPAEILAEALRPLIKDWVAENLPSIVEKLVADEISKLVKD